MIHPLTVLLVAGLGLPLTPAPQQAPASAGRAPTRIQRAQIVPTVRMPDLVGMTPGEAQQHPRVRGLGLVLVVQLRDVARAQPGAIVAQSVSAGDPVRTRSRVAIQVASQPTSAGIVVTTIAAPARYIPVAAAPMVRSPLGRNWPAWLSALFVFTLVAYRFVRANQQGQPDPPLNLQAAQPPPPPPFQLDPHDGGVITRLETEPTLIAFELQLRPTVDHGDPRLRHEVPLLIEIRRLHE